MIKFKHNRYNNSPILADLICNNKRIKISDLHIGNIVRISLDEYNSKFFNKTKVDVKIVALFDEDKKVYNYFSKTNDKAICGIYGKFYINFNVEDIVRIIS